MIHVKTTSVQTEEHAGLPIKAITAPARPDIAECFVRAT